MSYKFLFFFNSYIDSLLVPALNINMGIDRSFSLIFFIILRKWLMNRLTQQNIIVFDDFFVGIKIVLSGFLRKYFHLIILVLSLIRINVWLLFKFILFLNIILFEFFFQINLLFWFQHFHSLSMLCNFF